MGFGYNRALITGGAGFIGSHLAEAVLAQNCPVTVLDNLSTGNRDNIAHLADRLDFVKGDIRDPETLDRAMAGCDVVFHEAAMVSVVETVNDPLASVDINDAGTVRVLDAARKNGVRRVVLASSAAVYGDDADVPNREVMRPRPKSPYAVQKLSNELYADVYRGLYGLETACLRYFNVFGPRQDPSSPYSGVISIFMTRAATRRRPVIFGDGNQYRDFVYVADVVRANLLAATAARAAGACMNIGTGRHVSINRLWQVIAGLAGFDAEPEYAPPRAGDIIESVADIRLAGTVMGYRPAVSFEQGLAHTFDWYRNH